MDLGLSGGPIFVEGGSWDAMSREKPEYYGQNVVGHPHGRLGLATELAKVVAFLASPAASWVSGTNVVVDSAFTTRVQFWPARY